MKSTLLVMVACALLAALPGFAQVTVMPVPWDQTNFASPHTVITGVVATLTATVNKGAYAGDTLPISGIGATVLLTRVQCL